MTGTLRILRGATALLVLGGASLLAAPPQLVQIQDVLYKADGTRFDGMVYIEYHTFDSAEGSPVPQNNVVARVTYGNLRVKLAPTTTASPAAYYRVRYNTNGSRQFTEYWAVPPSATALKLRDVRLPGPPVGSQTMPPPSLNSVLITEVSGLRDELDSKPTRGSNFSGGRVVFINSLGELESVLGVASDCVRVDGTSAPCATGGGSSIVFVDGETPVGVVDGSNASFTLSAPPSPTTSLQVFRNGMLMKSGFDYSLNGSIITFGNGAIPQVGDTLLVHFRR
jgi:hypothetical protein